MEVRLEGDPDPSWGPSQIHHGPINEYPAHFPRVSSDGPEIRPSLCTHLHIETWFLLMGLRDLAARLSEGPEKQG